MLHFQLMKKVLNTISLCNMILTLIKVETQWVVRLVDWFVVLWPSQPIKVMSTRSDNGKPIHTVPGQAS